jgi:hypothetical protein
MAQLRQRSEQLFTDLLQAQAQPAPARRRGVRGAARPTFSWFDPDDAVGATALAFRLAALSAARKRPTDALALALDHVEEEAGRSHPEGVRQGFALFVTHNVDGRRLHKPRTVVAAPGLFRPPARPRPSSRRAISTGGAAPQLDYWREDALANEHHQHWHEVYPYTGLPPRDFRAWAAATPRATMVEILESVDPAQDWQAQVPGASVEQLAEWFAQVVQADLRALSPELYRILFRLNDRQGELFFYMHQQMLARYDAELLSNGLTRVAPFGPSQWPKPIPEGHDPVGLPGFGPRPPQRTLGAEDVSVLRALAREIRTALSNGALRSATGEAVSIDRTNFGEAVEAAVTQLRALDPSAYRGLHNVGHGRIARLSGPTGGVMRSTVTAIRDQVFWRWHKYIDDLNAEWQKGQPPYAFDDAPEVVMRNGLEDGSTVAWSSPDIILCRTADLPAGASPESLGSRLFGGDHWSEDFSAATATSGSTSLETVSELTTRIETVQFGGRAVRFLTHDPFSYFLRIENRTGRAREVTVRVFLAPAAQERDRRAWIEMDKFLLAVPAHTKLVAYRPDTASSVVKRPVDTDPTSALGGGGGPEENAYCDCGWPYTLLLPRGTAEGMESRLVVICTDAALDQVPEQDHCGSMSYCGAVDRYPDTRDMGYPFSRPFDGPAATAIRDAIVALPSAAGRTVTIRHT